LPTQAEVDAAGIELELDEARLVLALLSGVICRGHSVSRDKVTQMMNGLVACCHVYGTRDGFAIEAAHPELPRYGWPAGATAMRRLGIDHDVLARYWRTAKRLATDASVPLTWAVAFVPAALWPAVLTFVGWGPEEAAARLEEAVFAMADQPLFVQTRRRKDGATLSAGTINTRITGVLQLCDEIVKLRGKAKASPDPALPLDLLEPWTFKPTRPDPQECGATWARVDTTGPSLHEMQALLHRLDTEARGARPTSRYWVLRRSVLAGLLCAHGQRIQAIHALDVDDYKPAHNFGDGTIGPAVVYRPGKTKAHDEPHVLALPEELAGWIEEWIDYTGRAIGQADSPMWPNREPKPGKSTSRLNASAFARLVSGHEANDGTGSTPLIRRGEDTYHGYNPHSYRHSCYAAMRRAGARAKQFQTTLYAEQTADDFARAVVGHDLVRGTGDIYRDIAKQQQHLARIAIEYAWEELRHQPSILGPDPDAIDEASDRVELLAEGLHDLSERLQTLEDRQRDLARARSTLAGDALAAASLESHSLVFDLARLQAESATVNNRLTRAREDLRRALDETVEIAVCDQSAYEERLASARLRAERALSGLALDGYISVRDIAEILDTTRQTVSTWIRKDFPKTRTPLWPQGAWSVDDRGARTLAVRDLNQTALTPIQQERLLLVQLRNARSARAAA
jgi:hypothetical protein